MKILHCILSNEYAGSEAYMCQLAAMQARRGDDVTVVIRDANDAYVARIKREAAPASIVCISRSMPSLLHAVAYFRMMRRLKPDIVHSHLGRAAQRAGVAARLARVPHVGTLHLDWRKHYALCDGVICIAAWQRKDIPASYKGQVAVIWNWYSGKVPSIAPNVPSDVVRFGSVGRLVSHKGMDVLIQAFARAFPLGDEHVSLTIVGQGPQFPDLETLRGSDPRIELAGYRDDVASMYSQFDVYVSAARHEPFGLTILEAMEAGCRLVATRTQGPSEFLDGLSVQWAAPGDVSSLAEALGAAVREAGRMSWDLRAFAPDRALSEIDAFYRHLLKQV